MNVLERRKSRLGRHFELVTWCFAGFVLLALAIVVWSVTRVQAPISADTLKTLVDQLSSLIVALVWPAALILVVLSICGTAERWLPMVLDLLLRRENDSAFAATALSPDPDDFSDSVTRRLTTLITEAYDQYEGPMAPNLVLRLQHKLKRAVQNGKTDILKGKEILWLHREARHDRLESLTLQICGASVNWCFKVDEANELLTRRAADHKPPFDLIISHMGDKDDAFTLYPRLPKEYKTVPFIVYTRRAPEPAFQARAAELKIEHYTNLPDELFEMAVDALNSATEGKSPPQQATPVMRVTQGVTDAPGV